MRSAHDDSIVALSSGRLPAAIAVVRTSGPQALAAAIALCGAHPAPRRATLRILRNPADGSHIDQALILYFPAPDTATGEDIVEYQCHGSKAVVDMLIDVLIAHPGLRPAQPGEFTRRALANGRIDLTQAEGLALLLEAESESQRRSALLRAEGDLRRTIDRWRQALLELSAEAEVAIDYADEDDGAAEFDHRARVEALVRSFDALLDAPRLERLRDGVRVVVAGPPNAGKSSLVNALAGEDRAIVTAIAGTTRDLVEVPLSLGGIAMTLVDTAGLRAADDEVEKIGISRAEREVMRADLLLWLGSAEDLPGHDKALLVAPKADLAPHHSHGHRISVVHGEGMAELRQWLISNARDIIPSTEQPSLTRREAELLSDGAAALARAAQLSDPVLIAEELRLARRSLDEISGIGGVEALLDTLFGRFCLGK